MTDLTSWKLECIAAATPTPTTTPAPTSPANTVTPAPTVTAAPTPTTTSAPTTPAPTTTSAPTTPAPTTPATPTPSTPSTTSSPSTPVGPTHSLFRFPGSYPMYRLNALPTHASILPLFCSIRNISARLTGCLWPCSADNDKILHLLNLMQIQRMPSVPLWYKLAITCGVAIMIAFLSSRPQSSLRWQWSALNLTCEKYGLKQGPTSCAVAYSVGNSWSNNGQEFYVLNFGLSNSGTTPITTPYAITASNPRYQGILATWNWQVSHSLVAYTLSYWVCTHTSKVYAEAYPGLKACICQASLTWFSCILNVIECMIHLQVMDISMHKIIVTLQTNAQCFALLNDTIWLTLKEVRYACYFCKKPLFCHKPFLPYTPPDVWCLLRGYWIPFLPYLHDWKAESTLIHTSHWLLAFTQASVANGVISGTSDPNASWETLEPNRGNSPTVGLIVQVPSDTTNTNVVPNQVSINGSPCALTAA